MKYDLNTILSYNIYFLQHHAAIVRQRYFRYA